MNIEFIPINYQNLMDCAILADWYNDPELNYLITPNFSPGPMPLTTAESLYESNLNPRFEKYSYFIVSDGQIVGDVNITEHPDFLFDDTHYSAWLGIMIASKQHQQKGIGKQTMAFIEDKAYQLGFKRMELGVFSFNTRAIRFYERLGYRYIGRIPNFTFYNGAWYDDLRYEKFIYLENKDL